MITSMTGFAALSHEDELVGLTVTVRTVNHRYLDVQIRLPSGFAELEQDLRGLVQKQVARGRVELAVTAQVKVPSPVVVEVNEPLVSALVDAADRATEHGWVEGRLTAGELFRFPQAVSVRESPTDPGAWQTICATAADVVRNTLAELDRMRRREGEFLAADLNERISAVGRLVDEIVAEADQGAERLREALVARVEELGQTVQAEPALVAQEVVKWVARSDIHEEVARLRGHLEHVDGVTRAPEPCGRKLDFLVQEMNREVNTIGSKAEGRRTGQLVVAAKAELEKLREQIQNVE